MGTQYNQLTIIERSKIEAYLNAGMSFQQIAKELERACSTISREVSAHKIVQIKRDYMQVEVYSAEAAQRMANQAAMRKGVDLKLGKDMQSARVLEELIKAGYSPYAAIEIARQKRLLSTYITPRTLYHYIYSGVLSIDESNLIYGPRRRNKQKDAFHNRRIANNPVTHPSIEERPHSVLSRKSFGHWEMDTVVGSTKRPGSVSLLTLVERKTRYLIVKKLEERTQACVKAALDDIEKSLGKDTFKEIFKSITMDNGFEFLDVMAIKESRYKGIRVENVYYCHPYCSSERGSNEVIHRFLRRRWPKGCDFSVVDPEELREYVQWINEYPRKLFDGDNSLDQFIDELSKI